MTNHAIVIRAQALILAVPSLVPAYKREALRQALERAKGDSQYAAQLIDVRV